MIPSHPKKLKKYLFWDTLTWSKPLLFWERNIDWTNVKTALELGGNAGGLSLWLAEKGIDVVCSDLEDVESKAAPYHRKYSYPGVITYQDIDATQIPYSNHFDIIVFKSVLGGVGHNDNFKAQEQAMDAILNALKPGGYLLFAENLTASPLHKFLRKYFISWGKSWRYLTLGEIKFFLRKFSFHHIRTTGFMATLGRNETQRKILGTLDKWFLNRFTPARWKYVAYGIAQKKN